MISVIVPTYQAEAHLQGLLNSLDSAPDWEVVLVDDGSTDATARIAQHWLSGRQLGRFIGLDHSSPGHARQVGLEAARCDFVTFADADDQVVTSVLESAPSALERFSADVFIAGYRSIATGHDLGILPVHRGKVREVSSKRTLTSRAAIWGKVYRRSFLWDKGVSFPALSSAEDVIFSWRLAAARPKTVETDDVGYLYWVSSHGQLTHQADHFQDSLESLRALRTEAFTSDGYGAMLADYAYWTGSLHVMRKSRLAQWPRVGRTAIGNYLDARGGGKI